MILTCNDKNTCDLAISSVSFLIASRRARDVLPCYIMDIGSAAVTISTPNSQPATRHQRCSSNIPTREFNISPNSCQTSLTLTHNTRPSTRCLRHIRISKALCNNNISCSLQQRNHSACLHDRMGQRPRYLPSAISVETEKGIERARNQRHG